MFFGSSSQNARVLILVVVEYGLGQQLGCEFKEFKSVLILVVVEYGLGLYNNLPCYLWGRLNPCCRGIWSRTAVSPNGSTVEYDSLNPCCRGIWSRTDAPATGETCVWFVLILVVVEYGLGLLVKVRQFVYNHVLILVVVEYGLGLWGILT